jgi:hypothetical protein
LWNSSSQTIPQKAGTNGKVFCNMPVNEVLAQTCTPEAVKIDSGVPVLWKQRDLPGERKIYFITNQSDSIIVFDIAFRAAEFAPEWWNPVDGSRRALENYTVDGGYTSLSLRLDAAESGFVVFSGKEVKKIKTINDFKETELPEKWDIDFENSLTGERFSLHDTTLFDWTTSGDERVKYFSGTATYKTRFTISPFASHSSTIHLENIGVVATVFVNGQEAGALWTKPYSLEISNLLKEGENELEIRVTNIWRNRIVAHLNGYFPNNPLWMLNPPSAESYGIWLEPSGIWGKTKIRTGEI